MGYCRPPWHFSGQALYQLSLVRVEEVRSLLGPALSPGAVAGRWSGGMEAD